MSVYVQVVVGGQFGSEAKGHVTKQLVDDAVNQNRQVLNIRVAGPNAGHSAVDDTGRKWALRQVPVGVVNRNPLVSLMIAPGSEIDLEVLLDEIDALDDAGLHCSDRLWVSPEATILTEQHKRIEQGMDTRLGSTAKGIGAARADRIMRQAERVADNLDVQEALFRRGVVIQEFNQDAQVHGTDPTVAGTIIVEGTQGYGLGLHAGFYPKCTSSDARAIDFLAMAGVNPWHRHVERFEVWVVARVYPIRVAGNSGPLANERTWEELGLPQEFTTVTKKVRRVGEWDADLIRSAVIANGGAPVVRVALSMADQKFPAVAHIYGEYDTELLPHLTEVGVAHEFQDFINEVETDANAPVRMITTGENTAVWVNPITR